MVERSSESTHNPESQTPPRDPQWVEMQRNIFPKGSIGFTLVSSQDLEGHRRPITIFNQPLEGVYAQAGPTLGTLKKRDIRTIKDFLLSPDNAFSTIKRANVIKEQISRYLAITPHARLIEKIFRWQEQYPAAPEEETEVINAVEEKLITTCDEAARNVLRLGFGLDDGIMHDPSEVSTILSIKRREVLNIIISALGILRKDETLEGYFVLPRSSIASEVFGAVFSKDVPIFKGNIQQLLWRVSDPTREKLERYGWRDLWANISLDRLVREPYLGTPFSPQAREEIVSGLAEINKVERQKQEQLVTTAGETIVSQPVVNNLLSGVSIPDEQLASIAKIPIEDLLAGEVGAGRIKTYVYNTLKRYRASGKRISTIGDLLQLTPEELSGLKNIGRVSMVYIADKLTSMLNLPPEEQTKISDLLIPSKVHRSRQEVADLRVQENMENQWRTMKEIIREANSQGYRSAEEIQAHLVANKQEVLNNVPQSWIVTALIEYALNHPEEELK